MDILVFGGAGFIGKHLCSRLVRQGHRVRAFNKPPCSGNWPDIAGVEWLPGDFTNPVETASVLDGVEVIFHLVSTTLPKSSNDDPVLDLKENVASTLHLLDSVIKIKRPPKIVFISSGGTVYGIPKQIPISENHPTDPICAYGVGKLSIEKYLLLYRYLHNLDYRVLRMANPYGEYQPVHSGQGVIPVFLNKALKGDVLEIWGDGSVIRDYIYIGDAIDAAIKTMNYEGDQRIFNVGSGRGYSLNDLIHMIGELLEQRIACHYFPARPFDVPVNVLDITLAKNELDWSPGTPLHVGLRKMLTYMKSCLD
ncbi:UDP-glucose 4-epimerase [Desulfomicrobium macestii]|uniref:UDP-glucose 4-epimerase n=2 Tax=Desulfomicrobium TaxID=898 RepID=A0A8G2C0H4_DESNO|nr:MULTISPECIES: NAD-dependent epimerase/dehydratase family protein [Desulfomicrobium]MBE1423705.1 UDP-glucose 4-epimerase [Desulfomicrobium macestii]SFL34151.1 UDP-glucose 4-epimerase [Desulfomicrobium norvegicum]